MSNAVDQLEREHLARIHVDKELQELKARHQAAERSAHRLELENMELRNFKETMQSTLADESSQFWKSFLLFIMKISFDF